MEISTASGSKSTWNTASASVQGLGHKKKGVVCQDAHALLRLPDARVVIAVADGAGSAARSELGSRAAVDAAVDHLRERLSGKPLPAEDTKFRELFVETFRAALAAVEKAAKERGLPVKDLAATLIVVVAEPLVTAVGQVGDGGVVVQNDKGHIDLLATWTKGEYANETSFLTSASMERDLAVKVERSPITAIAAFSDGMEIVGYDPGFKPNTDLFAELFLFAAEPRDEESANREVSEFLSSPKVHKLAYDDLTLVLAALVPSVTPAKEAAPPQAPSVESVKPESKGTEPVKAATSEPQSPRERRVLAAAPIPITIKHRRPRGGSLLITGLGWMVAVLFGGLWAARELAPGSYSNGQCPPVAVSAQACCDGSQQDVFMAPEPRSSRPDGSSQRPNGPPPSSGSSSGRRGLPNDAPSGSAPPPSAKDAEVD